MIYDITLKNKIQMYLSADSKAGLFRRCLEMYRVTQDDIVINNIIDEDTIDINKTAKKRKVAKQKEYSDEAKELLNSQVRGLSQENISARLLKGWSLFDINFNIEDIDNLVKKYDQVKVYYRRTGQKKNKQYIALVK